MRCPHIPVRGRERLPETRSMNLNQVAPRVAARPGHLPATMVGMASVTQIKADSSSSTRRRQPRRSGGRASKGERENFLTRVPVEQFDQVQELVDTLGMSRSDFGIFALIATANQIRAAKGDEPIAMPEDVARAVDAYLNPPQEALLA